MINIRNKRLMSYDGIECNLPTANDFTFFGGGGGKGGGGTKVVYVPQVQTQTVTKEVVKQAPKPSEQSTASEAEVTGEIDTSSGSGVDGRKRTLGGTRKLAIPVTTSR